MITIFSSCQNKNIDILNSKISELENRNKELEDSLNRYEYEKIISHELIGVPSKDRFSINEPNSFTFVFPNRQKFHKYDVYEIDSNNESRKLLYKNLTDSRFNYDFTPKHKNDKSFELEAIFDLDSIKIVIPASIDMTLTE